MKAVVYNFDWKNHFVMGQYGETFEFVDEHGTFNGLPVASFPLRILAGKMPAPPTQIPTGSDPTLVSERRSLLAGTSSRQS